MPQRFTSAAFSWVEVNMTKTILIAAYLVLISIIGWVLPYIDKKRAGKGEWRIRERTLFIVALLGGSISMYASMKKYRHKTKHKRFMIGIPFIIALQIISAAAIIFFYNIRP